MPTNLTIGRKIYAGLFMVTLSTIMYEILLTRIFSVTMWYHYAFVAISLALFGMTVGAILVYLFPNYFTHDRIKYHLALSSLLFAISLIVSFLTYLSIPFVSFSPALVVWVYSIILIYTVLAVPFMFSGVCVCLALTRFPRQVSLLYAADLAGAAIGCILLRYLLDVMDGPTAVIGIAFLAALGAVFFAIDGSLVKLKRLAVLVSIFFITLTLGSAILAGRQLPFLQLMWVKGSLESPPLYEKWNSYSRIDITGHLDSLTKPFGWGLSPTYPDHIRLKQLWLAIDATAGTVLTSFDGNINALDHLKYDVTNVAHYLKRDARVLVIGAGGGRDLLSALAFNQGSVLGVEINEAIIDAVNHKFGDFTGHLNRNPKVTFVNDEARSYIARSKDRFDIIQVSLIDTWAATAAGAFVLSENSLYTVDAWKVFLRHLNHDGVLSFSRWYFRDNPGEMYRLTALATASLTQAGIKNPRDHLMIVRRMRTANDADSPDGIGTMLVSKKPFSEKDLLTIEEIAQRMEFEVVLSPRFSLHPVFAVLASGENIDKFVAEFPLNITAPTDNNPFFFHMLRPSHLWQSQFCYQGAMSFNMKAIIVLTILLFVVIFLTFLCIILPLIFTTKKDALKGSLPLFIFFSSIGLGFMLIEISQMQRLIIFLGHPTYGLSVVLFSLLLSSGLGSYLTQLLAGQDLRRRSLLCLLLLLGILLVFGKFTPYAIAFFQGATNSGRVLVATLILFPIGLFMGMAFPLGMKLASSKSAAITPWIWGINGATSVCASVLAVVIALSNGISASFWTGFACYVVAFCAFVWAGQGQAERGVSGQGLAETN